jgi:hypothetical protein
MQCGAGNDAAVAVKGRHRQWHGQALGQGIRFLRVGPGVGWCQLGRAGSWSAKYRKRRREQLGWKERAGPPREQRLVGRVGRKAGHEKEKTGGPPGFRKF